MHAGVTSLHNSMNQICGLSEPKPQHLYTLHLLSHCLKSCKHTHTHSAGSYDLSRQRTGTWMLFISRQLRILHSLTWCLIAELGRTMCFLTSRCERAAPSDAVNAQHGTSRSNAPTRWPALIVSQARGVSELELKTHGLALTNFLDCNTRHIECSTRCVLSLGTQTQQRPIHTAKTYMKHAEVLKGNYDSNSCGMK